MYKSDLETLHYSHFHFTRILQSTVHHLISWKNPFAKKYINSKDEHSQALTDIPWHYSLEPYTVGREIRIKCSTCIKWWYPDSSSHLGLLFKNVLIVLNILKKRIIKKMFYKYKWLPFVKGLLRIFPFNFFRVLRVLYFTMQLSPFKHLHIEKTLVFYC